MALTNNTNYSGIKTALLVWADAVVGANKTRWAKTDYPKLAHPYATLEVQTLGRDQGIDQRDEVDNGGVLETTYLGLREMTVRVRVFAQAPNTLAGVWASDLLQTMMLTLSAQSVIDAFRVVPMSSLSYTPIVRADEQAGDRWEWIAETDLTLQYRSELFDDGLAAAPDDGGFIERTEITVDNEPTFVIDSTP